MSDTALNFFRRVATTVSVTGLPFLPRLHPSEIVFVSGQSGVGKSELFMRVAAEVLCVASQPSPHKVLWLCHRDVFPLWRFMLILQSTILHRNHEEGVMQSNDVLKERLQQYADHFVIVESISWEDIMAYITSTVATWRYTLVVVDGEFIGGATPECVAERVREGLIICGGAALINAGHSAIGGGRQQGQGLGPKKQIRSAHGGIVVELLSTGTLTWHR
eukprot:PhF_6_TR21981/c0_g1_i2/m.31263